MDKYIKIDDLFEIIKNMEITIKNDYESKKIDSSSFDMGIGVLNNLKQKII